MKKSLLLKTALVSLTDINKSYQIENISTRTLKNISMTVHVGELLAIVGASGSGKSTLMNIIGLLDTANSGQYLLQGVNIADHNDDELARLRNQYIGFVFQQFNLLPRYTALANVALPLTYRKISSTQRSKLALESLERVGMQDFAKHRPMQLSGGQQQRVAIARALVGDPQIILADEPTGALDSQTGDEITSLFVQLHNQGRTVIIITHNEKISARCNRTITLVDGEIFP